MAQKELQLVELECKRAELIQECVEFKQELHLDQNTLITYNENKLAISQKIEPELNAKKVEIGEVVIEIESALKKVQSFSE